MSWSCGILANIKIQRADLKIAYECNKLLPAADLARWARKGANLYKLKLLLLAWQIAFHRGTLLIKVGMFYCRICQLVHAMPYTVGG